MASSKLARLRAMADSVRKQIDDLKIPPEKLRDQIGESYVQELEKLTDAEAVQYLKSIDDSRVLGGYLILSKRLNPTDLAEICLAYMGRLAFDARLTGVIGIGTWLKRTHNKEASHALARMIRNPEEADEIRLAAYGSLELINWAREPGLSETVNEDKLFELLQKDNPSRSDIFHAVDWSLVDSFL